MNTEALNATELRDALCPPSGVWQRIEVLAECGSTNAELTMAARRDSAGWPVPCLLLAEYQTAGRGRRGRQWAAPAGEAVLASALVAIPQDAVITWLPLLAGLAAVRALRRFHPGVTAKWPNDVLASVDGASNLEGWGTERKLAGILVESLGDGRAVVGIGVNVAGAPAAAEATSLRELCGAGKVPSRHRVVIAFAEELAGILDRWRHSGGDVERSGLRAEYTEVCGSLGRLVRVEHAEGAADPTTVVGRTVRIGEDGCLWVRSDDGDDHRVHAGDVRHLRRIGESN